MGLYVTIGIRHENVNSVDGGVRAYGLKGADVGRRSSLLREPSGNREGKLW